MKLLNTIKAVVRMLSGGRRATGGEVRPIDHGDDIPVQLSPGYGTTERPAGARLEILNSGSTLYDVDGNPVPEGWQR